MIVKPPVTSDRVIPPDECQQVVLGVAPPWRALLRGVAEARDAQQPKEFGWIAHEAQTLLDAVALGLVELARRHGLELDDAMQEALVDIDGRSAP